MYNINNHVHVFLKPNLILNQNSLKILIAEFFVSIFFLKEYHKHWYVCTGRIYANSMTTKIWLNFLYRFEKKLIVMQYDLHFQVKITTNIRLVYKYRNGKTLPPENHHVYSMCKLQRVKYTCVTYLDKKIHK